MRKVQLNTTGIKFTPSTFITYYEVSTNFEISNKAELLSLDEVKSVLNQYEPEVSGKQQVWNIAISTPIKEMHRTLTHKFPKK
jgi:hypothetical protein